MAYRFFSVPAHRVVDHPQVLSREDMLDAEVDDFRETIERALGHAEFRDMRARDRLRSLLGSDRPVPHGSPGAGFGPSAVFATPPADLPALLRLADELDSIAVQEAGERALMWKCHCGARYAVPVALVRPVSILCERCREPLELHTEKSLGEESLVDPFQASVNLARMHLARFFREAMARGWPVLVSQSTK